MKEKFQIQEKIDHAKEYLHPKNVYLTRLHAVLLHATGTLEKNLLCFPRADRHLAFQLLRIVKTYIEEGKRNEAIPYAYEAMTIFEVSLGLEHPYFLQTLALWTYLDQKAPKTNEELFALMNFQSNKPVDLSKILLKNPENS
ncbi:unnamed protein product [Gongylonema pulchrum]|uniref:Tetratricopeptide repeat protein n=1 Tax=Gongylonema pulchrum TaxID=637853 RepID=A0A183EWJ9_9BILA|nr:unnamed protein product [Gongylonema pulchrum]